MSFAIKLSPWAALALMKGQPVQIAGSEHINPAVLGTIRVESAFERCSLAEYDWQKMQETMWYRVCPFVCRLIAVPAHERWLAEAAELDAKKDFRRAYIAACEAFRMAADRADVAEEVHHAGDLQANRPVRVAGQQLDQFGHDRFVAGVPAENGVDDGRHQATALGAR
jgi:hypothetical protein